MSTPDIYTNQIGQTLVIAPTETGRLNGLASTQNVVFQRDGDKLSNGLTRWVFADLQRNTLKDQWNNSYDHEAHSLLVGSLSDGLNLLQSLRESDLVVMEHNDLFVPFQTLDIHNQNSSDRLREHHPRAFALSRRDRPTATKILTVLRDSSVI
ncbi:MAG: hypothetical protein ACON4U_17650 [Myxococcota bacterium]